MRSYASPAVALTVLFKANVYAELLELLTAGASVVDDVDTAGTRYCKNQLLGVESSFWS